MSSLSRSLAGPVLTFKLQEHLAELRGEEPYRRSGRTGRTLAKSGRFRVTLVAMAAGNEIGTHHADSPMTLHLLEGHLGFRADGSEHELRGGEVLFFGPGDAHDIRAQQESALLITLSAVGEEATE
ncbi:MAG: hypothetical protein ACR2F9_05925 [Longimicrobiaceae bacterium]